MKEFICLKTYAKINLLLGIRGILPDSYHDLQMLNCSVDLFDYIEVRRIDGLEIKLSMAGNIACEKNSAYLAATAFCKEFGERGLEISVQKGIYEGAGLGGSSANAAGVLFALCRMYDISQNDERIKNVALSVGADVPYMMSGGFAMVTGKGENIESLGKTPNIDFVIVSAGNSSTTEVFKQFDKKPTFISYNLPEMAQLLRRGNFQEFGSRCGNSLTDAAVEKIPEIADNIKKMRSFGADISQMTGSGSGVYGAFADKEKALNAVYSFTMAGKKATYCKAVNSGIKVITER